MSANIVAVDTRNKAPEFEDQDDDDRTVCRTSPRPGRWTRTPRRTLTTTTPLTTAPLTNAADNVGGVVTATDPDPNAETPQYSLSGADAMYFRVRDNGQIEVGASAKLDYEATKNTYMVTLTATGLLRPQAHPSWSPSRSTDVDEAPDVSGDEEAEYAENGTGRGGDVHSGGP